MPATTASRTRRNGTLLAIRNVFNSTDALSSEWPSENARSSDKRTSFWNSVSAACAPAETAAAAAEVGREVVEDDGDTCPLKESSESESDSSEEVTEPGSDNSRSE